ncbi:hypothetical protein KLVA111870_02105 [Klebsiella variicola]|uniref:hypothetical protein n=1 Tax=Klebsiella variicola TaxID=244366 RepID=UPI00109B8414|nr:hypothetical protein [Klebsiella variicola]VGP71671.1 hypothetical protein SB5387_01067 [Klebsiella variicola]
MSIAEMQIDCREVRIEGVRYDLIRIIADGVDIDDVMNAIKRNGNIVEALDCLSVSDVIGWIENQGYTVTDNDTAA